MNKSETIGNLVAALCAVQKALKNAVTDSENSYFNSRFASLSSVIEAQQALLSENGLAITQLFSEAEHGPVVETVLMHVSGEWISSSLGVRSKDSSAQAVGSGITYTRRYALMAILRMATEDDDGNQGTEKPVTMQKSDPLKANIDPASFVFEFGKFKGLKLSDVPVRDLEAWRTYMRESAAKNGPLTPQAETVVRLVEQYLTSKR